MSERIEHRDEIKPGRAAGRCDAVIRSIGLAWLVFAVLLAFAPARAEVALEIPDRPDVQPVRLDHPPAGSGKRLFCRPSR
jgi:hypothetical protein